MRLPPPIGTALPPTPRLCLGVHAFCAASVGIVAAWAAVHLQHGLVVAIASGFAAASTAAFASRARSPTPGPRRLEWNGERWLLREAGGSFEFGAVDIAMDLDRWLLLGFRSERGSGSGRSRVRWLPLRAADLPDSGVELRAALIGSVARPSASR